MALIHPLDKFFEQSSGRKSVDILVKMSDVHKNKAMRELEMLKRGGGGEDFMRHIRDMVKNIDEANILCDAENGIHKCKTYVDDSMKQMSVDISNKLKELIS